MSPKPVRSEDDRPPSWSTPRLRRLAGGAVVANASNVAEDGPQSAS
jgi:hypothetical protein